MANHKDVIETKTAWDAIGWDNGPFRIKGGKAIYQAVMYNCYNGGRMVKLARLSVGKNGRIQEVSRYVEPDTLLEFLKRQ